MFIAVLLPIVKWQGEPQGLEDNYLVQDTLSHTGEIKSKPPTQHRTIQGGSFIAKQLYGDCLKEKKKSLLRKWNHTGLKLEGERRTTMGQTDTPNVYRLING